MKASELRIGNLIWDDRKQKAKFVNHRVINDLASNNNPLPYSPIPLTEECLENFGFIWTESGWYYKEDCPYPCTGGVFTLRISKYKDYYTLLDNGAGPILKYVHQLENLYFALTGEELIQSTS